MSSIESYNVVVLILDPDSTLKQAGAGMGLRENVEHQAPHLTEEFALHKGKSVMSAVKTFVNENSG
jgi:hypothetical protein